MGSSLEEWMEEEENGKIEREAYLSGEVGNVLLLDISPGIGTKLYDPKAMDGLVKYLKKKIKEGKKIDTIIISGILPFIPPSTTKRGVEYSRILDSNVKEKYGLEIKTINSLDDAEEVAKNEMRKLNKLVSNGDEIEVVYIWSEEDWENVYNLVKDRIGELSNKKRLEKQLEELVALREDAKKALKNMGEEWGSEVINRYLDEISKLNSEINTLRKMIKRSEKERKYGRYPINQDLLQNVVDLVVRNEYGKRISRVLKKISRKAGIHILPYNTIEKEDLYISSNFNRVISNTPLKTSIRRMEKIALKMIGSENSEASIYIDIGTHKGGFRAIAKIAKGDGKKPIYLVQLPRFVRSDKEFLKRVLERAYRIPETKTMMYEPHTGGAVVIWKDEIGDLTFEILPYSYLLEISRNSIKETVQKVLVAGDFHIGSENPDLKRPSNYELLEVLGGIIEEENPDVVVLTGDLVHGAHRSETVYPSSSLSPSKVADLLTNDLTILEKARLCLRFDKKSTDITDQINELSEWFLRPYIADYIKKGGKLVIISGNHFNKSFDAKFDEAKAVMAILGKDGVYTLPGSMQGAGSQRIKVKGKYLGIFGIHQPRGSSYLDVIYNLMQHLSGTTKNCDLAVGGHYHTPGVGYADNTAYVTSPTIQQPTQYLDEIGVSEAPRGAIMVEISRIDGARRAKFHFLIEPWIEQKYEELLEKGKLKKMSKVLKKFKA